MALLISPIGGPSPEWKRLFAAEMPGLEVRMFPEIGDPAEIEAAAIARIPPGTLAAMPKLRLIISLMAGQETLLADRTLPAHVPIVRCGNPDGDRMIGDRAPPRAAPPPPYLPDYQLAQQRREWKRLPVLRTTERKVGVLGLGQIGLGIAKYLRDHGFVTAGWARTKRAVEGIEVYAGRDQRPGPQRDRREHAADDRRDREHPGPRRLRRHAQGRGRHQSGARPACGGGAT